MSEKELLKLQCQIIELDEIAGISKPAFEEVISAINKALDMCNNGK